jgi:hypothetical protein
LRRLFHVSASRINGQRCQPLAYQLSGPFAGSLPGSTAAT